jgi:hypothetical protein
LVRLRTGKILSGCAFPVKNAETDLYILKNKTKILKNNHLSGNIALPKRLKSRQIPSFELRKEIFTDSGEPGIRDLNIEI